MEDNGSRRNKIELPENVRRITGILESRGFSAYAVGGCVRDKLLGREPADWDITTSARPSEIKDSFKRTVDTGIQHGTVTVLMGGKPYEVTTFRVDGAYKDHRHPEKVSFSASLADDLNRRDFTINAMAYSEREGIIDLHQGMEDLRNGIIRCVGNPGERFDEDALRLLRALRFSAQLDMDIEEGTLAAVKSHAADLEAVSKERVLTELTKLICSGHIERLGEVFCTGLSDHIAKHFDKINIDQLYELKFGSGERWNSFTELENRYYNNPVCAFKGGAEPDAFNLRAKTGAGNRYIRFAYLCEGMEEESVRTMLRLLKADNKTVKNTCLLIRNLFTPLPADGYGLKKFMSGMDAGIFKDLIMLKECSRHTALYKDKAGGEDIDAAADTYLGILKRNEPVYLKDLKVTGSDITGAELAEGPRVGVMLKALLDHVQKYPEHNEAAYLLDICRSF